MKVNLYKLRGPLFLLHLFRLFIFVILTFMWHFAGNFVFFSGLLCFFTMELAYSFFFRALCVRLRISSNCGGDSRFRKCYRDNKQKDRRKRSVCEMQTSHSVTSKRPQQPALCYFPRHSGWAWGGHDNRITVVATWNSLYLNLLLCFCVKGESFAFYVR